jgi:hypothetical protein
MAKYVFKLVLDSGKIFHIVAKSRTSAIETYCRYTGANKEWVIKHSRIVNLGMVARK